LVLSILGSFLNFHAAGITRIQANEIVSK
jgi:hypothetical protein